MRRRDGKFNRGRSSIWRTYGAIADRARIWSITDGRLVNATILKEAVRPPRQSDGGMVVGEPPFGGDAFVMTQVMPPAGTLRSFVDSLTPARWSSVLARLPAQSDTLLVRLPKFRLEVTRKRLFAPPPLYLPHRTPEYTTRPIAGISPRERSTSTKRSVRFLAVMKSAAPTPGIE